MTTSAKASSFPQKKMSSRIPQDKIDEVTERVSLVEVVRGHVSLKRKGQDFWGCCPFHQEKSPSFQVREREGVYHCFGCGAHGNAIRFVMEIQGLPFPEAMEKLAPMAGVTLVREQANPQEQQRRYDGLEALERATVWFERGLKGAAKDYFLKRGLSPQTIETFRLGYAPDGWRNLKYSLQAEGFAEQTLLDTAVVRRKSQEVASHQQPAAEPYDTFRNRVMFPILNMQGKPVAFGGRVLDDSEPKYLNSPQTQFFNKSHLLYGLYQAAPHMRRADMAILVEGYMDVIGLYQADIKTAVAPMGTSVTEEQVALLWRYHDTPIVCLDGDSAGQKAAVRLAYRTLGVLKAGKGLRFALMPAQYDPDSYVQAHGKEAFMGVLAESQTLEDILWQDLKKGVRLETGQGRAVVEKNIGDMAKQVQDETMAKHLFGAMRDRMWQEIKGRRKTQASPQNHEGKMARAESIDPTATEQGAGSVQQMLLALVLYRPEILAEVSEEFAQLEYTQTAQAHLQEKLFTFLTPNGVEKEKWHAYLVSAGAQEQVNKLMAKFEFGKLLADEGLSQTTEIASFWKKIFDDNRRIWRKKHASEAFWGRCKQDITTDIDAWRKFKEAKTRGIVPPSESDV